ncbi:unnamed protein product [Rotaria socialis]|uniref:Alternative oxidase n=2 Tax=Rotaria socialis TaxID=392032 RepID=A0A820RSK2_9BILA|nr:unnamed protein product [Rotaria socialis]CAF4440781.1 unnamed protein product [Rotaria socialis]
MKTTRLLLNLHNLYSPPKTTYLYQVNSIQSRCFLHTSTPLMDKNMACVEEHPHTRAVVQAINQHQQPSDYMLNHEIYTEKELHDVKITHKKFESWHDRLAYAAVRALRLVFDVFTGYMHVPTPSERNSTKAIQHTHTTMTEQQWLRRFIFLESVAGVPGMVGGMSRHMKSLRTMRRDYGWIHTLLSEAENERMHLLTFLELRQPGWLFRGFVLLGQGAFFNAFFLTYVISPRICHRFVGFLEEEAVITYTRCIEDVDAGRLPAWSNLPAPQIAKTYWRLPENSMMRDVLLAVRADEANHREVNHTLADVGPNAPNPFVVQNKRQTDRSTAERH